MTPLQKSPATSPSLFVSAKCAGVKAESPSLRRALVWASLDADVRSIQVENITRTPGPRARTEFVVLDYGGTLHVLDVVSARTPLDCAMRQRDEADWRAFGFRLLTIDADDLARGTRFETACEIWMHRRASVPASVRIQALQVLDHDGTVTLDELLRRLRADSDPLPAVLAMACRNELTLDLGSLLGPETMVRSVK